MSHPMIKVKHLSKQYKMGVDRTYKTLQDSITGAFKSPLSLFKKNNDNNTFWALKDVSIEEGEVAGIIGRNGAGRISISTARYMGMRKRYAEAYRMQAPQQI